MKRPRCSREVEAILDSKQAQALGFTKRNGRGAHVVYRAPDGRAIVFTRQNGDLSTGLRAHLCRELARYGLLVAALAAVLIGMLL